MKSISLELPLFTRFCSSSSGSRSKWVFYGGFSGCLMFCRRWNCYPKPPRLFSSWEKDCSLNLNRCSAMGTLEEDCGSVWGDSEFVEVIGIGSRKDAVIDFCLNSPLQSSSVRFWYDLKHPLNLVHILLSLCIYTCVCACLFIYICASMCLCVRCPHKYMCVCPCKCVFLCVSIYLCIIHMLNLLGTHFNPICC